jgi:hypothetical protein
MYQGHNQIGAAAGYGYTGGASPSMAGQGAMLSQGDAPSRQSQINEELEILSRAIDHLGMTANSLADRLHPVRRQTCTGDPNKTESPPDPPLCLLADSIRCLRKQLEGYTTTLVAILNELEV